MQPVTHQGRLSAGGFRFAVVSSRWNDFLTARLVEGALDALEADEPEAIVDDYSRAIKAGLSDDQDALYPQIEQEFLALIGTGKTATGADR